MLDVGYVGSFRIDLAFNIADVFKTPLSRH